MMLKKWLLVLVLAMGLGWGNLTLPALAAPDLTGAQLFETHCAACHSQGGNLIRRGKTLQSKALARNQVNSLDAIATLVTHGKNAMTAFGDRLSPAEIERVSQYVLDRAAQNWK